MTANGDVAARRRAISESAFQAQLLKAAALMGWRTAHFRPAQNAKGRWRTPVAGDGKGFPDLVLVRGDRLILAELKRDSGTVRPDQRAWLDDLAHTCAEVHVWRPRDWDDILATLRPDRAPATGGTP